MIYSIKICCNNKDFSEIDMGSLAQIVYSNTIDNSYDILVCDKYSENIFEIFDEYNRIKCIICGNTLFFKNKKTINRIGYSLKEIVGEICEWIDKYPFIDSIKLYMKISGTSEQKTAKRENDSRTKGVAIIGRDNTYIEEKVLPFLKCDFCAVFDFDKDAFYDKNGNLYTGEIDVLFVINALPFPANKNILAKRFENFDKEFIGFFEQQTIDSAHRKPKTSKTPITLIVGFAPEIGKFDVMCCLNRDFRNNKIPVACCTGNAMGMLFDNMYYFEPTPHLSFRENITNIQNHFLKIDDERLEMIIINVPGGCGNTEDIYTDCGGLSFAHLRCLKIDAVIFCVNDQIDKKMVLSECEIFKAMGAEEVIIVESDKHYLRNAIAEGRMSVYIESESIKRTFGNYAYFDMSMVQKGDLFKYLYQLFTTKNVDQNAIV